MANTIRVFVFRHSPCYRNGLSDEEHRPDEKRLGISKHRIRAIGEIRGMPKAACACGMLHDSYR
ncbi:MAG: hypothetical protein OXI43_19075 [Candidatus Poribacteria bacterium]|nr:hypothetical protein [Candidatus Poribacteria bacterium]